MFTKIKLKYLPKEQECFWCCYWKTATSTFPFHVLSSCQKTQKRIRSIVETLSLPLIRFFLLTLKFRRFFPSKGTFLMSSEHSKYIDVSGLNLLKWKDLPWHLLHWANQTTYGAKPNNNACTQQSCIWIFEGVQVPVYFSRMSSAEKCHRRVTEIFSVYLPLLMYFFDLLHLHKHQLKETWKVLRWLCLCYKMISLVPKFKLHLGKHSTMLSCLERNLQHLPSRAQHCT